ncbi:DNA-directed RNA polymerase specialized sigma subunit [Paenibacillus uliginis N3/975]|uniref:DNA-directed RNA polymerase specialized sigma subunit n=1 Tax=Paenibacillus uliginis N3/975 TaxID=1313296 RepID=A0A1X7HLC6_9BACL|nr:DNA-directed RNA polymerase specialized sigma subunit [Paenibacillus uliginis N3/975]
MNCLNGHKKLIGNYKIIIKHISKPIRIGNDRNWFIFLTSHRAHNLKKFDNTGEDMEDLISIGTIGLIRAIESYCPNKGTKLATFAARKF